MANKEVAWAIAVIAWLTVCRWTSAGTISEVGGGHPFAFPPSLSIPADNPNNDDASPFSENLLFYAYDLSTPQPVDTVITVGHSGGATEYDIVAELINHTGQTWQGVQVEVGFGTGSGFERANAPGLDLDTDPSPSQDRNSFLDFEGWLPDVHTASLLRWEQGAVLSGNASFASFSVDVPDLMASDVPLTNRVDSGFTFTLRYTPVVPEPSSIVLAVSVGGTLLCRRPTHGASSRTR